MNPSVPIAIVGIGGVFPGAATLADYWRNIVQRADAARDVPPERWILDPLAALADHVASDKVYSLSGCFVENFLFDPRGLAFDADQLETIRRLDPLFHFVLHAGRDAFENARTDGMDRSRIGVALAAIALPTDGASAITREVVGKAFARSILGETADALFPPTDTPAALNAGVVGLPAALLADALNLGGGAFTLDAACASSLYAIKLACDELAAGRADAMLAGGVSRPECLYTQMGFSQLRALSASGRCSPFDESADGLLVGEGAGVVMLKRLDDALRDGDRVYAVIRGIGLSNDIGGSLLAPDSEGQLRAMRAAYEQAGWSPTDVDLIECHGTGTPAGDAVEIASLRTLWQSATAHAGHCPIGSVKSNVGHLLTAAGAAGLIKVLLAMREGVLPPSANFDHAERRLELEQSPFRVQTCAEPWNRRDDSIPRRAAISAFGFGGINAHVLIEEYINGEIGNNRSNAHDVPAIRRTPSAGEIPIAIVGMDARFGPLGSLAEFEIVATGGRDACINRPPMRWRGTDDYVGNSIHGVARRGAFMRELQIPVGKYHIPPSELPEILPQQLVMLESVSAALTDARLPLRGRRPRAAVLIGMSLDFETTNFHLRWWLTSQARRWAEALGVTLNDEQLDMWLADLQNATGPALNAARTVGALGGMIASRIAREFQFGGPSFAVSSEEASGLRAVEIAAHMLQRGEIDAAVAGAVDLAGDVRTAWATNQLSEGEAITSPPIGDGAATVVLKRLEDAVRDGDRVYAILRDFSTERPQRAAGFSPRGRSNTLAASAIFISPDNCLEVRSDAADVIGQFGAATGMISFVRAVLALHHRTLPAGTHSHSDERRRLAQATPWLHDRANGPRRARVSSIAPRGESIAINLEEFPGTINTRPIPASRKQSGPTIFALTGHSVDGLSAQLEQLSQLADQLGGDIDSMSFRWFARVNPSATVAGDTNATHRLAIVVSIADELRCAMATARDAIRSSPGITFDGRDGVYYAPSLGGTHGEIAFVYPGSGNHYIGMGRQLFAAFPWALDSLERDSSHAASLMMADWFAPWTFSDDDARLNFEKQIADDLRRPIFGQVGFGVAMTDLLAQFGLRPHAVIGYSLGESVGLFATRAWPECDEMLRRMFASPLFATDLGPPYDALRRSWNLPSEVQVDWRTVVVPKPAPVVRDAIAGSLRNGRSPGARLLIINTPDECVIGGLREDVDAVMKALRCRGVALSGVPTVHCDAVASVAAEYRAIHELTTSPPPDVRFYSAATAAAYNPTCDSAAESITRQAVDGFDFPAVINRAYADGVRLFIEIGPQASCTRMIGRILGARDHLAQSASGRGEDEISTFIHLLAALYARGASIDFAPLIEADYDSFEQPVDATHRSTLRTDIVIRVPIGGRMGKPRMPMKRRSAYAPAMSHLHNIAASPQPVDVISSERDLIAAVRNTTDAAARAHDTFLRFSRDAVESTERLLAGFSASNVAERVCFQQSEPARVDPLSEGRYFTHSPGRHAPALMSDDIQIAAPPLLDRAKCLEFAVGKAANILGPEFAIVDTYAVRVRLPDEPLMLVDRILIIDGAIGSLTSGRVVTEHDVLSGAWYLDGDRAPICITVEAGQADLFLSGYLGIDLVAKGVRTYRLLDATVTFHRGLPQPGETIRYDIVIDRFVRQGETYMFFFGFDGTIDGQIVLTMRDGCAGFFTRQEIENSHGIVLTADDKAPANGRVTGGFAPLVPQDAPQSYSADQIAALRRGNLGECFGAPFDSLNLRDPLRLPGGRMTLIHRVTTLDVHGGRFGLGLIVAEADVQPDDWYLTCHFVDDMVMPGTLMYECCVHTLRFFLLRIGWVGERRGVCHEPITGISSALRCRGPVTPKTKCVRYELHIKEIGYRDEADGSQTPYILADALMSADDKCIVRMDNMSLQVTGLTRERIESAWNAARTHTVSHPPTPTDCNPSASRDEPNINLSVNHQRDFDVREIPKRRAALYDYDRILAFAIGKPSDAFGEPYAVFDSQRRIARLPGPPYQFLDRVIDIEPPPWVLEPGGWITAEYDVPVAADSVLQPGAWYFAANRQRAMPFAVLLEIALQPCGWLAAYCGSALTSDADLNFRNLGGRAVQHAEVFAEPATLTTRVRMTSVSRAGGMIIQKFDFEMRRGDELIYDGDTSFGFFSRAALAQQVGIRDAAARRFIPTAEQLAAGRAPFDLSDEPPFTPEESMAPKDSVAPASRRHNTSGTFVPPGIVHPAIVDANADAGLALQGRAFRMIDRIDSLLPDGGPLGLGYIAGSTQVDPAAWFFKAHFYQDPVWPGSLGLESFLQLLKVYARDRWPELSATHRFESIAVGLSHEWQYRGQIIPRNKRVEVSAVITRRDDSPVPLLVADGFLSVDGIIIYEILSFGIRAVPM